MSEGQEAVSRKALVRSGLLTVVPFVGVFVVFLILLQPIELRGASDDVAHIAPIMEMGKLAWLKMRATTWQPRVLSDFAFAVLLFHLSLWKVLNAAVMATLLWIITRVAFFGAAGSQTIPSGQPVRQTRRFLVLAAFVCLGLFLIHPNVITSGSVWFTGSFYYLWPTTAMFLGLTPFLLALYGLRLPLPALLTPACFMFSLCACQTEQAAAVQLGVSLLVLVRLAVKRARIPRVLIAQFAMILLATAAFFYFDFTSTRVTAQPELSLFPEFANFNLADKLMLGVNVYTTHLLHVSNILFTVFLAFAGWLAFRRARRPSTGGERPCLVVSLLVFVPALWALVNTLPLPWGYTEMTYGALSHKPGALNFGHFGWLGYLYTTPPMANVPSVGGLVLSVVAIVCVLSPFYLLWQAFSDKRDRYLAAVLYLASLLSGILIGFSPSIWASESRPNYISNFILLLLLAMLLRVEAPVAASVLGGAGDPVTPASVDAGYSPTRLVALVLMFAFAVYVIILYFTTFATNTYWWY